MDSAFSCVAKLTKPNQTFVMEFYYEKKLIKYFLKKAPP